MMQPFLNVLFKKVKRLFDHNFSNHIAFIAVNPQDVDTLGKF
jgi:hypothetical protein